MTFEQFKYYLDAYGASLERWPAEARREAKQFLLSHREAMAARAETGRLDALLDRARPTSGDLDGHGLVERVALRATAAERASSGGRWTGMTWVWSRAAALAIVALLGVVTGTWESENRMDSGAMDGAAGDVALLDIGDVASDIAGDIVGL